MNQLYQECEETTVLMQKMLMLSAEVSVPARPVSYTPYQQEVIV